MATMKVRRDDTIQVLTGKDKGKRGKVREVRPDARRIVVADVNVVKKHIKPGSSRARQAGIVEIEAALAISNVALVCTKCDRPTRVGMRFLDDGSKARFCKKCGEVI